MPVIAIVGAGPGLGLEIAREYWSLLQEPDTAERHYAAHRAA